MFIIHIFVYIHEKLNIILLLIFTSWNDKKLFFFLKRQWKNFFKNQKTWNDFLIWVIMRFILSFNSFSFQKHYFHLRNHTFFLLPKIIYFISHHHLEIFLFYNSIFIEIYVLIFVYLSFIPSYSFCKKRVPSHKRVIFSKFLFWVIKKFQSKRNDD